MIFLTSVIDSQSFLSSLSEYQEQAIAYVGVIAAVTALGLFVRSLL